MIVFYSLLGVLFLIYLWVQRKSYFLAWKLGGPIGLPFIGNRQLLSPKTALSYVKEKRDKYSSPFTAWVGPVCVVYINDPENIGRVLSSPDCIHKSIFYDYITQIIGSGLLTSKNPEWNAHRKLFNPLFKTQNLMQLVSVFTEKMKYVFGYLKKMQQLKEPFDIMEILQYYTFSVSFETITGCKSDFKNAEEKKHNIIKAYNTIVHIIANQIFNPLYRFDIITKIINNNLQKDSQKAKRQISQFLKEIIEANSKLISNEAAALNATEFSAINYAVQLRKNGLLSTPDIFTEMNHLIVASYQTSSDALLHIVTLLAIHPEWQEKLYEEISETFPDKDAELTYENILDTPLTDMVIKEVLRLLPVSLLIGRKTNADVEMSNNVVIPKGVQIVLDFYSMHTNPAYWGEDVLDFNPYRFLNDEIAQRHPNVYMPFSKGVRNCIGWRYANLLMKVFLIKTVQHFRFSTDMKLNELELIFNLTSTLAKHPYFTVEERPTS